MSLRTKCLYKIRGGIIINNIIKYYLDSEAHFKVFVDMFLTNGFYSISKKDNVIYEYISDIAIKVAEHAQANCGFHLCLSDEKTQRYFCNGYSDIQLFSIIFAEILKLNEEQISFISSKGNSDVSFSILHSILCGEKIENIEQTLSKTPFPSSQRILLEDKIYPGNYYIKKYENYNPDFRYPWRRYFDKSFLEGAEVTSFSDVCTDFLI